MPVAVSYPGVYIEEIPSGVRTITGVATSITAFVGRTRRGPVDNPIRVQSFPEFERRFGGLWVDSLLGYAVYQFFLNGGTDAIIVRVHNSAVAATVTLPGSLNLVAANPGVWGGSLRVRVDHKTRPLEPGEADDTLFNLSVKDFSTGAVENFLNISVDPNHKRYVKTILEQKSNLVRVSGTVPATRPTNNADINPGDDPFADSSSTSANTDGDDGQSIGDAQVSAPSLETAKQGLWLLEKADLFNILCIPPFTRETDIGSQTWAAAAKYCQTRRAMFILDPPSGWDEASDVTAATGVDSLNLRDKNVALFFPRVKMPDPLKENRLETFAPCGVIAGIFARTDTARGVWKAPAGIEATLTGVVELAVKLTDGENGQLNPLGVNCLRSFPVIGKVVWGSRTMRGADQLADEWKYIPVRRTALFIEESLYRGTQWVVFEPNDEPLWAQIRLNIGAFMQNLFRQGAFQGQTPRDAYFVKCDKETTTQNDINLGIVNIVVGFAPLKPAEFVIIKIQQMAGQIEV